MSVVSTLSRKCNLPAFAATTKPSIRLTGDSSRKCENLSLGKQKVPVLIPDAARWFSMAIYRLIQTTAFEPKDIERFVVAYEQTLRALRLKDRSDPITQLVAEKIIAIGRLGIEDPTEISKLALKELWG